MEYNAKKQRKRHLIQQGVVTFIFLYMLASILWWYVELSRSNKDLLEEKQNHIASSSEPSTSAILETFHRNEIKYLSEGITVGLFVIIGWIALSWLIQKQHQFSKSQSIFLSSLAHEIKTPITISKLILQGSLKDEQTVSALRHSIEEGVEEINRLNKISSKLLLLLQLEGGLKIRESFYPININPLIIRCVKNLQSIYGDLLKHQYHFEEEFVVLGNTDLIETVLYNLIENACKHSKTITPIEITLNNKGSSLVIGVRDSGIALDSQLRKHLFRKQQYHTMKSDSLGLGLYLSQIIIKQHRGTIRYTPALPGNLFIVELPKV